MSDVEAAKLHQIGAVAERVGLSLRTIRHYDELGIVRPTGHSPGGFRLYTDDDIERLLYIKAMKPLKFTLEETAVLLDLHDRIEAGASLDETQTAYLRDAVSRARERCGQLERQLGEAQTLTSVMSEELRRADRD
jgi:DNA-binding transcriptional MerR regulator